MDIPQVACPECGAKLSSKAGFTAGQRIKCPKCQNAFAVPAAKRKPVVLEEAEDDEPRPKKRKPAPREEEDDEDDEPRPVRKKAKRPADDEDDEDDRPRKKKKKDKKEGSYATSPLRFVILGVLVIVMLVLAYFLYRKFTAEDQDTPKPPQPNASAPAVTAPPREDGEPSYLGPRLPKAQYAAAKTKAAELFGTWKLEPPAPGKDLLFQFNEDGTMRRKVDPGRGPGLVAPSDKQLTWVINGVNAEMTSTS